MQAEGVRTDRLRFARVQSGSRTGFHNIPYYEYITLVLLAPKYPLEYISPGVGDRPAGMRARNRTYRPFPCKYVHPST